MRDKHPTQYIHWFGVRAHLYTPDRFTWLLVDYPTINYWGVDWDRRGECLIEVGSPL